MHPSVQRHDEVHFPLLLVEKLEYVPVFAYSVSFQMCEFEQTARHHVLELSASRFVLSRRAVGEKYALFLANAARKPAGVWPQQKDYKESLQQINPFLHRGCRNI